MGYPDYYSPDTYKEALELLRLPDSKPIAGGTDLVPKMRAGVLSPRIVVDLQNLGLDQITESDHRLILGACVKHAQIVESSLMQNTASILATACRQVGSPPIRNRGTIGGNIVNASPAADSVPALLVLDATLVIADRDGKVYEIPLENFFLSPGKTILRPGEILKEIHIVIPHGKGTAFLKAGKCNAMAISIVNVAACLGVNDKGVIDHVHVALGSAAPTPVFARQAEAFLLGKRAGENIFAEAAELVSSDISPISDVRAGREYRLELSKVMIKRVLNEAWLSQKQWADHD
jgi:CO/xanthine dehydrogenase FAD-binding subunit